MSDVQSGKIPVQKDDLRRLNLKVSIHLGENPVTLIALTLQHIGRVNGRCNLFYT